MNGLLIRPYRTGDAAPLGKLLHQAVRNGTGRHYTHTQRVAWSPKPRSGPLWVAELCPPNADTLVAEWRAHPVRGIENRTPLHNQQKKGHDGHHHGQRNHQHQRQVSS